MKLQDQIETYKKKFITTRMATEIKISKSVSLFLSFETQNSPNGRPFRLSGSRMHTAIPAKWIDGMWQHHFIHSFRYLDEQDGFFEIECDYQNKYINNSFKKLSNQQ